MNNKTGMSYARSILTLANQGYETPINLEGILNGKRYIFNGHVIALNNRFSSNKELNSFLIEKLYEELLFKHKKLKKHYNHFL